MSAPTFISRSTDHGNDETDVPRRGCGHGVRGLLVTTAVIGTHKIERAVKLAAKQPDTMFSVDDTQNVRDLNGAAAAFEETAASSAQPQRSGR